MRNTVVSRFSSYKSTIPKDICLYDWFKNTDYINIVNEIRRSSDKEEIGYLKSLLPAITVSGRFSRRRAADLIQHSKYICIDIDAADNPHILDFSLEREKLSHIDYVAYCSLSASGKGVFCIIPIKHPLKHKAHFESLKQEFSKRGITIDKSCSDVTRLRLYSYDEAAYLNENPMIYEDVLEQPFKVKVTPSVFSSSNRILDVAHSSYKRETNLILLQQILLINDYRKVDITVGYLNWRNIASALANEFGEEGRQYFHRLSKFHERYNNFQTDNLYSSMLNTRYNYSFGTIIYLAQQYGII